MSKDRLLTTWALKPEHVQNWAYWNNVFSPDECAKIIELGNSKNFNSGIVRGEDQTVRDSEISWLFPPDAQWVFERLTDVANGLNDNFFKFDLFGFAEGLQFTKYTAPGGKYDLHLDKSIDQSIRKLSMTLQLSSPDDYEGGELILQTSSIPEILPKEQGKLIAFPSYLLHGVQPVTKGIRYSLVAWITGPAFK